MGSDVQHIQAIESLERWAVQMDDLIKSKVFGTHIANRCLYCRAVRIMTEMDELANLMKPQPDGEGKSK